MYYSKARAYQRTYASHESEIFPSTWFYNSEGLQLKPGFISQLIRCYGYSAFQLADGSSGRIVCRIVLADTFQGGVLLAEIAHVVIRANAT